MHARRPEADAGQRRREHHRPARLDVVGVGDRAAQVPAAELERLGRPHVGDRVRALVGRAVAGRLGPRPRVERDREVRLGGVAHDVQARRRDDLGGQRPRQLGIDDRLARAQVAVRDAALDLQLGQVEHRDRRRLRPAARRRRDRQVRHERRRRLAPLADRRVDVGHHRRRVAEHEVRDLRGVDRRSAADRHEAVGLRLRRRRRRRARATRASAPPAPGRRRRPRCPRPRSTRCTRSAWPAATTPGIGDRNARVTPRRLSSQPASSTAPDPNLMGVASIVKIVSWLMAAGAPVRRAAGPGSSAGRRVSRSTKTWTNQPVATQASSRKSPIS